MPLVLTVRCRIDAERCWKMLDSWYKMMDSCSKMFQVLHFPIFYRLYSVFAYILRVSHLYTNKGKMHCVCTLPRLSFINSRGDGYRFANTPVFIAASNTSLSWIPSRYLCVIAIFSCPITLESVYRSSPFFNCMWAKVCRRVWGDTRIWSFTPTSFAAYFRNLVTASGVSFLPVRETK